MLLKEIKEKSIKSKITIFMILLLIIIGLQASSFGFSVITDIYEVKDNFLTRVNPETTLQDLRNNLENQDIIVLNADGEEILPTDYVGSGMKLIINDEETIISVIGDVDGNGKVTVTDVAKTNLHKNNIRILNDNYTISADMNNDGKISITDLVQMNQVVVKIKDIIAPESFEPTVTTDDNIVTIYGETSDILSGIKEYWFKIDDGDWFQNDDILNGSYSFTNTDIYKKHFVTMKVTDNLGNVKKTKAVQAGGPSGKLKIIQDKTEWTNKNVDVYFDIETNVSDAEKYISIDGGETFEKYAGPVRLTKNAKVVGKLESDKFGLLAQDELEITNLDILKPNDFTPQITTNLNSITINAITEDAEATSESGKSGIKNYKYTIRNGDFESFEISDSPTYTFTNLTVSGDYEIEIIVTDNAKNKRIVNTTVNLKIDCNVTFNANGGSIETERITQAFGEEITFPISTREGYSFMGWYDNEEFDGESKVPGSHIVLEEDMVYYAKWQSNDYVITYEYNGATKDNAVTSKVLEYGEAYGELESPNKEYKLTCVYNDGRENIEQIENYVFDGWYKEDTFENKVEAETIMETAENHTLYAKWTRQNVIVLPSVETRDGYDFIGWYEDSEYSGTAYEEDTQLALTKDVTMYAKWVGQNFNVDYDYKGATSGNIEGGKIVTYGEQYGELPNPGREFTISYNLNDGTNQTEVSTYIFDNWYKEQSFSIAVNSTTVVNTAQDHIIYAKWTDGDINLLTPPERYGYTFNGWYETSELDGTMHTAGENYKPIKDMTFYAKWSQDTSTLTIDANGATYTGLVSQEQYIGTIIRIADPIRAGYTFNGWEVTEGNGTISDEGFTFGTQNTVLKAKWILNTDIPIYATLYDTDQNGTGDKLVFTANNRLIDGYGDKINQWNITGIQFDGDNDVLWKNRSSIVNVEIADKIYPTSTAFWFCEFENLTSIDNINNLDTSNVTNMEYMFRNCEKLTQIDVSNFDTSNVTNMFHMFSECSELRELDLTNFDTHNVRSMACMFYFSSSLNTILVSQDKWVTTQNPDKTYMFFFCGTNTVTYVDQTSQ